MIVITAELHSARTGRKTLLGRAKIANDVVGMNAARTLGNYNCHFTDKADRPWKEAKVRAFPRKRLLMWDLLFRALREAVGDRNS